MRVSGFGALVLAVLSLLFWIVSWSYWNVFMGPNSYGSAVYRMMQGIAFIGSFLEYAAIIAVAIGLIAGHKARSQSSP